MVNLIDILINKNYFNNTFDINHLQTIYNYFLNHPDDINKKFYNPDINNLDCPLFYALRQNNCIYLLLFKYIFNIDFNIKCNDINCFEYFINNYLYNKNYFQNNYLSDLDLNNNLLNLQIKIFMLIRNGNLNMNIFKFNNLNIFLNDYYNDKTYNNFKYKDGIVSFMNEILKKYYPNNKNIINKHIILFDEIFKYDNIINDIQNDNFKLIIDIILSIFNNKINQFDKLINNYLELSENNNLLKKYINLNLKFSFINLNSEYIIICIKNKFIDISYLSIIIKMYIFYNKNIINRVNKDDELINLIDNFIKFLINYDQYYKKSINLYFQKFNKIFNYYFDFISNSSLIDLINKCNEYNISLIQYIFTLQFIRNNNFILRYIIENKPNLNSLLYKYNDNKYMKKIFKFNNNFNYEKMFDFYGQYYKYDNVKELIFEFINIYKNINYIINNIYLNKYKFYINPSKVFNNNILYPNKYIQVSFLHFICCIKQFNKNIENVKLLCNKYPELINDNNNELKISPLQCAVIIGNKKIINVLLNINNINLYLEDINKNTILEYLILNDYSNSYLKMFIEKYNIYKLHNNENIIILAIRINNNKIIHILEEYFNNKYDFYYIGIANWIEQLKYQQKINF